MTNTFSWNFSGEFVGKGKIIVDGKEVEAELKFVGNHKETNREERTITFDLIEQGEDGVLTDVELKG